MNEYETVRRSFPSVEDIARFHKIDAEQGTKLSQSKDLVDPLSEDPETLFFLYQFLNPQKKAVSIERFIYTKLGGVNVSASEDKGDALIDQEYYEIKISTTNQNQCLNLRQIRLYQDVDYYICAYIQEADLAQSKTYLLTKDEMKQEVEEIGGYTHGTKAANVGKINPEHSITLPVLNEDNKNVQRWNRKYWHQELYDILNKESADTT